ncbi:MAG: hypothetical protein GY792_12765 [Gammaproteobacteria bacterium]|nr:hypothetical protein [Gammaproteobacteria bacterium]
MNDRIVQRFFNLFENMGIPERFSREDPTQVLAPGLKTAVNPALTFDLVTIQYPSTAVYRTSLTKGNNNAC